MENPKTIILSRTDGIGDAILTLPVAGILKEQFPGCKIFFLGRKYTKAIIDCCENIDTFLDWDEIAAESVHEQVKYFCSLNADALIHVFPNREVASLAKRSAIPIRIGTSHRSFHWLTCNKLLNFTRKNSELHEAQLNLKLLSPFGINGKFSLSDLQKYFGFSKIKLLNDDLKLLVEKDRFNLIFHPKSKGSAREWGIDNYSKLIQLLPKDKFKIFITGTKEEGEMMRDFFLNNPEAIDLTGKLSLDELISFINSCDGLVAASTGPLHIAAVLGKKAVGIFAPMRPIHPGRWSPIGKKSSFLVLNKKCSSCRKSLDCECIRNIDASDVYKELMKD